MNFAFVHQKMYIGRMTRLNENEAFKGQPYGPNYLE